MITFRRSVAAAAVAVLAATTAPIPLTSAPARSQEVAPAVASGSGSPEMQARRAYAVSPLAFEANRGQVDRRVEYLARGEDFTLFLTRQGAVFDLHGEGTRRAAVRLAPVGASTTARLVGRRHQGASTSYFRGSDARRWQSGVPAFGRARYLDLYPGIDLVFRGDRSGAEYDYVAAAGSDPSRIGYRLRGADDLRLRHGDLVARTAAGDFVHHAPIAYQVIDGQRRPVEAAFRLRHGVVGFDLGSYDRRAPLVIDPETDIDYGTYLGGDQVDEATAVTVEDGDVYLTGYASSADFPTTTGAYDSTASDNSNVFVAQISPDGNGAADLVYSTYLGGGGDDLYDDEGLAIAVADGDIYLAGVARSGAFPTTAGALDSSFAGETEGFFAKISPDGAGAADLVYSTYLGGSGAEAAKGIAVADGDVYLTGRTDSADFPTTAGAFDRVAKGSDAFLARISPDGAGADDLVYGSFVGATGFDTGNGIAVEGGDAWVTGYTSGAFPTTAGAYDRSPNGQSDVFLARLSPDGAGAADLAYSTLLGTDGFDIGEAIAVEAGEVYLTGWTGSLLWPTTPGAQDRFGTGHRDAFVARLSPEGAGTNDLTYSTYLDRLNTGTGIAVEDGDVYVGGYREVDDRAGNYFYGYVARLSLAAAGASDLEHLTVVDDSTTVEGIAVEGGVAYVTGSTGAAYAIATPGAYDTTTDGLLLDAYALVLPTPDNVVWPDALIRRAGRADIGDDRFDGDGGQTARARVRKLRQRTFWITAQNDDNNADRFVIGGGGGTSRKWAVRYFAGAADITEEMTAGTYQTSPLAPGEEALIKLTIKPRRTAKIGSVKCLKVTQTSLASESADDSVEACVRVKRGR